MPPYDWVLPEVLTVRIVHTESPAVYQLRFRFPYPGTGSHMTSGESLPWLAVTCLPLKYQEQWFVLCLHILYESKKKKLIFILYSAFHLLLGCNVDFQIPYV